MTDFELSKVFSKAFPRLDMFFHFKLKDAGYAGNREDCKKELAQVTVTKVMEAVRRGQLQNNYQLEVLINLSKKDVWNDFIKPRAPKPVIIDEDPCELNLAGPDSYLAYQVSDKLEQLLKRLTTESARMVLYLKDGYSYGEIGLMENKTEAAVKQHFYRLRDRFKDKNDHKS